MKRKLFTALCVAAMLSSVVFAGCQGGGANASQSSGAASSGSTSQTGSESGSAEEVKVIVAAANMADPFYSWLANSTVNYLKDEYPEVSCKVVDLQGDDVNVPVVIEQAILEGYNGLILDKPTHAQNTDALLQEAKEKGVNTVLSNNSDIKDGVSSSSGASNYLLGFTVGKKAAELLPQNAKVCVILSTPGDAGSEDRWTGYQDALKEDGRDDIEILAVKNNDGWAKEKAMTIMEDSLQIYPEIDAVLAMNDGMALGAIEACKADGRDVQAMQFYGIDGLGDACISIQAGELTTSVLQDANDMGSNAGRIVMGMIKGEITTPEEYFITPITITEDNVADVIEIHKANGAM